MHRLDTDTQIFFYENEFYIFSNYSAFALEWKGKLYPTSEHAYHSEKFSDEELKEAIRLARSAHDSQQIAIKYKDQRRPDWAAVKVDIMRDIITAKVEQHEYVKRKLIESGDKELIEDSWRDDFWGWGPEKNGHNQLGKLWMEIRPRYQSKN